MARAENDDDGIAPQHERGGGAVAKRRREAEAKAKVNAKAEAKASARPTSSPAPPVPAQQSLQANDAAVLFAVLSYPNLPGSDDKLRESVADADAFSAWLTSPAGGALPIENVHLIRDQVSGPPIGSTEVQHVFRQLIGGETARGRRLYIYAAGLAFLDPSGGGGVLTSDASASFPSSVDFRGYADYFRKSGRFQEVVLLLDCIQVSLEVMVASSMPLVLPRDGPEAHGFYAVAINPSERGRATKAFLRGLASAPAGGGLVSLSEMERLLKDFLGDVRPSEAAQFYSFGDMGFTSRRVVPSPDAEQEDSVPASAVRTLAERVSSHSDDPATIDELARRPFAEVIAARIEEVAGIAGGARSTRAAEAFAVHLHGPWGAGKSSVLNFLREHLQSLERPLERRWVVVELNAWQQQRMQPPWWTLIKEVYLQSARQIGPTKSIALKFRAGVACIRRLAPDVCDGRPDPRRAVPRLRCDRPGTLGGTWPGCNRARQRSATAPGRVTCACRQHNLGDNIR